MQKVNYKNIELLPENQIRIGEDIIDKRTGMPADNNLASVTVIAENRIMADALATALLVMGENEAKEYVKSHKDIEIILIDKKGNVWQSEGVELTLK